MIGIITQDELGYEEVEELRDNPSFAYLIQATNVPSESALRQLLDELGHDVTLATTLFEVSQEAIKFFATLSVMEQINQKVHVPGNKHPQNH